MKSILELSEVKAYRYFMESSNYCSLDLPKYIDFSKVLTYVEGKVGKKTFEEILKYKEKKPSEYEGVNHRLLIKKDAQFTYRPIDVANPYLYYLLVRQITTKGNWNEIKRVFSTFVCPNIDVISIPKVKGDMDKSHKAASITDWWENVEQKTITLSLKYRYMFVTDIINCYGSIYTHTIAWALMSKDTAKQKKGKPGLLGNIIDSYMQGMQYGQTNGIPQGSALFDFIAEMVLGYADSLVSEALANHGITDYKILRYRDDYRIFCNKKDELEKIAFVLQDILANLNFQLNAKKTFLTEDVIENALKPDKLAYMKRYPLYRKAGKRIYTTASSLQQELIYIHQFAKEFPNSGTLRKLLTNFSKRLNGRKKMVNEPKILIAILTEIALGSPKCYPIVLQLCSVLINKLSTTSEREEIVNDIYRKFQMIPNIGELQIWMQRITYQWARPIDYSESICKIVANVPDVVLWNNEWVADEYKDTFPQYEICTNWLRDCYTPVIDIDEVSLFDKY